MSNGNNDPGAERPRSGDNGEMPSGEDVCCWLCHGEGDDDDGQPLRRDCSCRGGSGFAHVSCIVDFSKHNSENWDGRDIEKFKLPWIKCPHCHQDYQGELCVELVTEFVAFAEDKYEETDPRLLCALSTKMIDLAGNKKLEEAKRIGIRIISAIDQSRRASSRSLPRTIMLIEGWTCMHLGHCALREGTEEGKKSALELFEKGRAIFSAQASDAGVLLVNRIIEIGARFAESNVAAAKSESNGNCSKTEDQIKEECEEYKRFVAMKGEGCPGSVHYGVHLVHTLECASRTLEAERLAAKLAGICNRVHGPGHRLTQIAESRLQQCREKWVWVEGRRDWFIALRYEENGSKCVVKGPIPAGEDPRSVSPDKEFVVASEDVHFSVGTVVVCQGLEDRVHLNGKTGEVMGGPLDNNGCFKVRFEDASIEPEPVKREFLRIQFELPEEE